MQYNKIAKIALASSLLVALSNQIQAAGISGTKHDLSSKGWGSSELCIFCHTPHNGNTANVPLWNHGNSTAATFTLYSSPTLNAVPGQPAGTSKACLSCHDGTVAIDTFGTQTGTHFITGIPLLGTDLSNDHPVSFTYDAALATADTKLVTPNSASFVDAGKTVPLFSGKLECASCHNVHDNTYGNFLRISNAGSALCLKCHNK